MIGSDPDQSLPRSKILRGKRNFQRLFERSVVLKKPPLLCRYRVYKNPKEKCLYGFVAPKKQFRRAVDRNKVKRWMREAFRINQHLLPAILHENKIGFHAIFMAIDRNLTYKQTEQQMSSLLRIISDRLAPASGTDSASHSLKND